MKTRKSWREKMDNPNPPKLVAFPLKMQKRFGAGTMLVPSPREVEVFIRTVRKGSVTTISQIREFLAGKHSADVTCPLTTGIFVRIAAEAAEEDASAGKSKITPYWRVSNENGPLHPECTPGAHRPPAKPCGGGH